ncbi:homoserine O-acetyltransferase [Trifolium repens]|nr:homoserine O-acetyltransferase [Trifolium repens]
MAVSVSDIVGLGRTSKNCLLSRFSWRVNVNPPNTALVYTLFPTTTTIRKLSSVVRAQNSTASLSQKEDSVYVAKLVVGSFGGAAAIKYGSAIFPEITTPNLVLALVIISTPVLVAVLLLINQSLRSKL